MALSPDLCYSMADIRLLLEYYKHTYSSALLYFSFTISIVICLLGLVGNALVICFIGFIMKKRKTKYWFLNLAIADFLSLLAVPLHAIAIFKGTWPFGPHMCRLFLFSLAANMYYSIFILIALNIARVLSVAQPMFHQKFMSQRVSFWICFIIWIFSGLSSLPMFFYSGEIKVGEVIQCCYLGSETSGNVVFNSRHNASIENVTGDILISEIYTKLNPFVEHCSSDTCCGGEETLGFWNHLMLTSKRIVISLLVIGYLIPLGIVIVCNMTIIMYVRKSKTINTHRLCRVVVLIIMVYFITWTPIVIAEIVLLITVLNKNLMIMFKIFRFLPLLITIAYVNRCLNPIVYVLCGGQMRTGLSDFISRIRNNYK